MIITDPGPGWGWLADREQGLNGRFTDIIAQILADPEIRLVIDK